MVRPDGPAETFLNRYAEFAADPAPSGLRHHYVAYRAVVRAKVALLRHDQGEPHAAADATAHLELALRHLRDGVSGSRTQPWGLTSGFRLPLRTR